MKFCDRAERQWLRSSKLWDRAYEYGKAGQHDWSALCFAMAAVLREHANINNSMSTLLWGKHELVKERARLNKIIERGW